MDYTQPLTKTAGIDEVGRGSLFGPVFAGAVVLNKDAHLTLLKAGLKDSKLLSPIKRAQLVPLIQKNAKDWALGKASSKEVDEIGIRSATEQAMVRALRKLQIPISLVLVDGVLPLRSWEGLQQTVVHGERKYPSIAAASVLAKEARDEYIKSLSNQFPGYGLEKNVGYGTAFHRKALLEKGPTSEHRKTFLSKILAK